MPKYETRPYPRRMNNRGKILSPGNDGVTAEDTGVYEIPRTVTLPPPRHPA